MLVLNLRIMLNIDFTSIGCKHDEQKITLTYSVRIQSFVGVVTFACLSHHSIHLFVVTCCAKYLDVKLLCVIRVYNMPFALECSIMDIVNEITLAFSTHECNSIRALAEITYFVLLSFRMVNILMRQRQHST